MDTTKHSPLAPRTELDKRYKILKLLHSRNCNIYAAGDLHSGDTQQIYAIKELVPAADIFGELRDVQRVFERQVKRIADMRHSAIPRIHRYFMEKDRFYIVMDYINGMDLNTLMSKLPELPYEEWVVDWAIQLCDALDYLHNLRPDSFIFGHLKPTNIMLTTEDNKIKLVGFGLSRIARKEPRPPSLYAPPEQHEGAVSIKADIYALGATMHYLLTGQSPKDHPKFSFAERPPQEINPVVSSIISEIILKATANNQNDRYWSAEEMDDALKATLKFAAATAPVEEAPVVEIEELKPSPPAVTSKKSGEIIWTVSTGDEIRSTPLVYNNGVYVTSYDSVLYVLDYETGKERWRYTAQAGIHASPYEWNNAIFIASLDNHIYCLNARTGRSAWDFEAADKVRTTPAVDYGHVFVGADDGNLYVLNARNGKLTWQFSAKDAIRSSPLINDENIIFGCNDNTVYCVSMRSRKAVWKFATDSQVLSSPVSKGELIFIGSNDKNIYALNAGTGRVEWKAKTRHAVVAPPSIADDVLLVAGYDKRVYALVPNTGKPLWKFEAEAEIVSSPAVADGRVYFGSFDTYVYCLDLSTGEQLWKTQTGERIFSSPCVYEGIVYIGSSDHNIYAIRA